MNTPFRSPSSIVSNNDGTKRFITNFAKVGKQIYFGPVEYPNTEESLTMLFAGVIFSKLD